MVPRKPSSDDEFASQRTIRPPPRSTGNAHLSTRQGRGEATATRAQPGGGSPGRRLHKCQAADGIGTQAGLAMHSIQRLTHRLPDNVTARFNPEPQNTPSLKALQRLGGAVTATEQRSGRSTRAEALRFATNQTPRQGTSRDIPINRHQDRDRWSSDSTRGSSRLPEMRHHRRRTRAAVRAPLPSCPDSPQNCQAHRPTTHHRPIFKVFAPDESPPGQGPRAPRRGQEHRPALPQHRPK